MKIDTVKPPHTVFLNHMCVFIILAIVVYTMCLLRSFFRE